MVVLVEEGEESHLYVVQARDRPRKSRQPSRSVRRTRSILPAQPRLAGRGGAEGAPFRQPPFGHERPHDERRGGGRVLADGCRAGARVARRSAPGRGRDRGGGGGRGPPAPPARLASPASATR